MKAELRKRACEELENEQLIDLKENQRANFLYKSSHRSIFKDLIKAIAPPFTLQTQFERDTKNIMFVNFI